MSPEELHSCLMMLNLAWKEIAEEKETDALGCRGDVRFAVIGQAAILRICAGDVRAIADRVFADSHHAAPDLTADKGCSVEGLVVQCGEVTT